jgi:chromosome segregation ATPase
MSDEKQEEQTPEDSAKEWKKKFFGIRRRYESLSGAVEKIKQEYEDLAEERDFYKTQLANAELNIQQQKDTLINLAGESNRVKDDMGKEIALLRAEIKRLKNGDINNVGN